MVDFVRRAKIHQRIEDTQHLQPDSCKAASTATGASNEAALGM